MSVAHWQRIAADYSLQKKNPKKRTVQGIIAAWNARRASKVKQNKKTSAWRPYFISSTEQ
jgi:hypothetical protein